MSAERAGGYRDLDAILADHARRRGGRVWLESIEEGSRLTFGELDAASNRVAHFLANRGVRANERISLLADNGRELAILFLGIQRYGATANPLNVEVSARNLAEILHDVAPRLVLWDRAVPDGARELARAAGAEALAVDEVMAGLERFPAAPCERRVGGPRDIAVIDYTSGTTARPKGVCISHEAYFYMARASLERLGLGEADRVLECRSLAWASPQVISLVPTLQAGATLVLARKFSRRRFFDWIREHGVTVATAVPTILAMLLEQPLPLTAEDLPRLRFVTSSAAPLPVDKQLAFERRYGIPIVQMCGMTEAGVMGGNPPGARRLGSIGLAMPSLHARFVDEHGEECEPGREGELVVDGPQLASAYLVERGRLVDIPRDGLRTGDVGYADGEGYLYLTGRKKDLIIRGGVNIAPLEITTVLLAHPAVREAATIGVPDNLYGERIVSFVALRPGRAATPADLLEHCRARLAAFKLPEHVLLVDAIPKNARGKVAREPLEALWRDCERTGSLRT